MNKTMLSSYEAQSIVALDCCKISSVNDFKQVKRHRLLGTGAWEEVAPDGELTNNLRSQNRRTPTRQRLTAR